MTVARLTIVEERQPAAAEPPVASSPAMRALMRDVQRAAHAPVPALVLGETGSGKEVIARELHRAGPRAAGPFQAINCGALPDTLLEGLLFGFERGAFTGAEKRTEGLFVRADGGTVFLDEVGELSLRAQASLLRVLETRRVLPLGASAEIAVDVRIVAATHRDLGQMVRAGTFREDLYYRLHVLTLTVPPLRERPEEIEELALSHLLRTRRDAGAGGARLSAGALSLLAAHPWPGNVRELQNVIAAAAALSTADILSESDIAPHLRKPPRANSSAVPTAGNFEVALRDRLLSYEGQVIREALEATRGCVQQAARRLRVPVRTLHRKIAGHGIAGYARPV